MPPFVNRSDAPLVDAKKTQKKKVSVVESVRHAIQAFMALMNRR